MFYCVWSNCFRQDMNDKIIQKKTKYFDIRWLNKSKKNKHKDVLDFCARIFWSNFVSLKIKIETLIPTKIIDYYHWDEKNLVLHISNRIIQKSLNFRLSSYNCFFPKNNVWKDWKYGLVNDEHVERWARNDEHMERWAREWWAREWWAQES